MTSTPAHLLTPTEAENEFGSKYFYRQRIYRLAENDKLQSFTLRGKVCFLGGQILRSFLKELENKIVDKFPEIDVHSLQIFYDQIKGKRIVVDGIFGKSVEVDTDKETEENLISKIEEIRQWIRMSADRPLVDKESFTKDESSIESGLLIPKSLPEEINWIKVDTGIVDGVEIKSFILVSLPSIAQFIGIKSDQFTEWLSQTTFMDYVLSLHSKKFNDPDISGSLKRGVVKGYTPLIPFEILPEVIIAYKQSGRSVQYPEKVELLYQLSKTTLEAVGLAISGNKDKAAQELAKVGKGLGLTVADQIIGIFKQYESRDYQILTNKEFNRKVKEIGADYAITSGTLTLGITGRTASHWRALGTSKHLPKKLTSSGREVMRQISPDDGVGMTFGERHYIKDPNVREAVETGKQGKEFYKRLKDVGLLDD